jgi:hypothetical protein
MKKILFVLCLVLIGSYSFANKVSPLSPPRNQFQVEAQYDWPVDDCGQTLTVIVTCTGYCDPNGNMRDAANDYVLAHWNPETRCYIP